MARAKRPGAALAVHPRGAHRRGPRARPVPRRAALPHHAPPPRARSKSRFRPASPPVHSHHPGPALAPRGRRGDHLLPRPAAQGSPNPRRRGPRGALRETERRNAQPSTPNPQRPTPNPRSEATMMERLVHELRVSLGADAVLAGRDETLVYDCDALTIEKHL